MDQRSSAGSGSPSVVIEISVVTDLALLNLRALYSTFMASYLKKIKFRIYTG